MENEANHILAQAHLGQYEILQAFLNNNPQYHWSDIKYPKTGDTLLHVAARLGHLSLLEYLLRDAGKPAADCKNNDDKTALHEAAQFHQPEAVKMLVENGAQINALKRGDWTPLMLACTKPFPDIVHILLDKGAAVNITNKDGWGPLHLACRTGCLLVVKKLLDYKADVAKLTKNGRNCLHIACLHGHIEIVRLLLRCKIKKKRILDVNSKDGCGNTPLHEAVLGRNIEICQVLLDHGAEKESTNKVRFSLLHLAASGEEDLKMVRFLVESVGLDVNNLSVPQGLSALHCAARNKRRTTYETLVKLGAKEELKDAFGRTAKDYFK